MRNNERFEAAVYRDIIPQPLPPTRVLFAIKTGKSINNKIQQLHHETTISKFLFKSEQIEKARLSLSKTFPYSNKLITAKPNS